MWRRDPGEKWKRQRAKKKRREEARDKGGEGEGRLKEKRGRTAQWT